MFLIPFLIENADLDDACLYGDIVMWSDYLGLWEPSNDIEHKKNMCKVTKNSRNFEFGLCEPQFKGGDTKSVKYYQKDSNL